MAPATGKLAELRSINEAAFRSGVLVPVLKKMGCCKVRETHGANEYGKDIIFYEHSSFGKMYCAVVAKVGDISGAASGRDNYATIVNQIDMAFDMPIEDIEDGQDYNVNRVIVWTTGKMSNNARNQILKAQKGRLRNVIFKDGDDTIDLLEEHYPSYFAIKDPYVIDYFIAVKKFYSKIEELKSLGGLSDNNKQLSSVFVSPTLTKFEGRRNVRNTKRKIVKSNEIQISFNDLVDIDEDTVVLGEGGSGKSTLLRKLLLQVIEGNEISLKRSPIPVLVECKRMLIESTNCIYESILLEYKRLGCPELSNSLDEDLVNGDIILCLDALDELQAEDKILQFLTRLKDFKYAYPKVRIVITSRIMEILEKPNMLTGYSVFQVNQFTRSQMSKFIENWYGDDQPVGKKLLKIMNEPAGLGGLPSTPLTIVLVAILYEKGNQELPANLTELFQKYVELALGRWDVIKEVKLQIEWKIKEFVLKNISWQMHQGHIDGMLISDFENFVVDISEDRGLNLDVESFVMEILARSELLVENADGEIEFKHRSFQDYFVGAEISSRADADEMCVNNFLDPWWSQAIFFACGLRAESGDYIRNIMDKVSVDGLDHLHYALSLGSITQATYLAPKSIKIEAIQRVLSSLAESWDIFTRNLLDLKKEEINLKLPSHMSLLDIFGMLAQMSLGSQTLSAAISDVTTIFIAQSGKHLSAREKSKLELSAHFLAVVSARCDNHEAFISLVESELIKEPSFLLIIHTKSKRLSEDELIDDKAKSKLQAITEKLEKRLARVKEYRLNLKDVEPIPLPPPESKEGSSFTIS